MRQLRIGLFVLALLALVPGIWGTLWPRSFFDDFPVVGGAWVAAFPPYNEHLVRDAGAFFLGFGALMLGGVVIPRRRLVQVSLVSWLVALVPHGIFHLTHLDALSGAEATGQIAVLALMAGIPLWLLGLTARMPWRTWSQSA